MMPGSLLAYTISATVSYGFWAGPLLVLGHAILELTLIAALIFGLHQFLQSDTFNGFVGVIGGAVLIVMGSMMFRRGWSKSEMPMTSTQPLAKNKKLIISGIVVSMSNPYWFIWWATIGMTYLLWSLKLGYEGVAYFFTGHILADLGWYALVAFIITSGRKVIDNNIYSGLMLTCGVVIIGLGIYFTCIGLDFLIN